MTIRDWSVAVHRNAVEKGFGDQPREFGTSIALIHSELSEALEAHRINDMNGVAEELADAVIRTLDLGASLGIDLEAEIAEKHAKNLERPRMHGKQY